MYDNGDILLFALSSERKVTWPRFKRLFGEVHQRNVMERQWEAGEPAADVRWQVLRALSCLGHIDLHFNQGDIQVVVAPPLLAALPGRGPARAVLCGARSPGTIQRLERAATAAGADIILGFQNGSSPYLPARVELRAENPSLIHTVAANVNLRYIDVPPARSLARVAASLQEYLRKLVWLKQPELNWRREDFDTTKLRFLPAGETSSQVRLSRYQDPVKSIWRYRLWRNDEWAEVELDWGRYSILAFSLCRVLRYDLATRRAYVPYGAPLPALFARALGLCSGHSPTLSKREPSYGMQSFYIFDEAPPSVFNAVATKLRQQPIERR